MVIASLFGSDVRSSAPRLKGPTMFHQYIKNAQGVAIDIDRARFLADDDLWNDAVDECKAKGLTDPQEVWERYCVAHKKRHGEPFAPHVTRNAF